MQITRSSIDTAKGPGDWFTGEVYIDSVAAAPLPCRVTANLVHFMPGARTHWHRHPMSQTVFVTEGIGLCQRRGGPIEVIRPGDRVLFEADEEHRHGAAANRLMVHLAIKPAPTAHGRRSRSGSPPGARVPFWVIRAGGPGTSCAPAWRG